MNRAGPFLGGFGKDVTNTVRVHDSEQRVAFGANALPTANTHTFGNSHATANVEAGVKFIEAGAPLTPIGLISMFGANSQPAGWLLCNGQPVARSGTYAPLYGVIGLLYGNTTPDNFCVPNLVRRFPMGADIAGGGMLIGNTSANTITGSDQGGIAFAANTTGAGGAHDHTNVTLSVVNSAKDSSSTTAISDVQAVSDHTHSTPAIGAAYTVVHFIIKC